MTSRQLTKRILTTLAAVNSHDFEREYSPKRIRQEWTPEMDEQLRVAYWEGGSLGICAAFPQLGRKALMSRVSKLRYRVGPHRRQVQQTEARTEQHASRIKGEKTPEEQARWDAIDFGQILKFSPKRRRRGGHAAH